MALSSVDLSASGVFLLKLRSDDQQHRFDATAVATLNGCLDKIETFISNSENSSKGPFSLVVYGGDGKFFSNGLSLEYLAEMGKESVKHSQKHADDLPTAMFLRDFTRLLARFLTLSIPTVAAINGHAYAGGCMLAMAMDKRVMFSSNGRYKLCLNEVLIGMGLPIGMNALCQCKIPASLYRDMALEGRAVTAEEAIANKIIDEITDNVLSRACEIAQQMANKVGGSGPAVLKALKEEVYRAPVQALRDGKMGYAGPVFLTLLSKM